MGLTKPRAAQIYDIDYKQATRVLTVNNITLLGGAPSQVDGVNLSLDDRILVIGQTTQSQNGIYFVDVLGTGSNGTWVRTGDTDVTGELLAGTIVMVTEGLLYHDTQWKLTTDDPIVIGTTPLIFEQNSAFAFGNVYANNTAVLATSVGDVLTLSAGNNIAITGNNVSKTVTIGVTGISLNSISNGTSNVNVVSSGGNVTVGVGGTGNVAVFSSTGANITGTLSVTGAVIANSTLAVLERITVGSGGANAGIRTGAGSLTVPAYSFGIDTDTGLQRITTNQLGIVAGGTNAAAFSTTAVNLNYDTTVTGNLTVTGNVSGGNLNVTGNIVDTGPLSIITSSNGNIDLLPNGTGNVNARANVSVTGQVTTTGNITGSNVIGNTNAFKTIVVSGQSNVVANTSNQTLTLATTVDSGLTILTDSANNTVTFDVLATDSIFATGGDMGTVTEAVTSSEDLGSVADAVTVTYDLGSVIDATGLIYPSQLVLPSYTSGTLPTANPAGQFVFLSTSSVGAMTAFSDGTNWRFTSSGNIVS